MLTNRKRVLGGHSAVQIIWQIRMHTQRCDRYSEEISKSSEFVILWTTIMRLFFLLEIAMLTNTGYEMLNVKGYFSPNVCDTEKKTYSKIGLYWSYQLSFREWGKQLFARTVGIWNRGTVWGTFSQEGGGAGVLVGMGTEGDNTVWWQNDTLRWYS